MRRTPRLLLLVLLLAAFALVWLSPLRAHLTRDEIRAAIESVRSTWYAPLLLIAAYAAGCVFAVPASLFIVAAGAIWGWLLGGTFAMAGGILGAMASFQAGRIFGGSLPARAERHLRGASFRSLLVLRLLPLFPFAALNYGAGIVRADPRAFFLSTLLGLIPSNYVFAWSADEIFNGTLTGAGVFVRLIAVAAVAVTAVLLPGALARMMQRRAASR